MKRIFLMVILMISIVSVNKSNAQITVGLNFNIGSQPAWGPVGYDYAEYYYLPDIDVYYNVQRRQYIYMQNDSWQYSSYLPSRARNYDIYRGHKVVINEPKPYLNNRIYKEKYANYKGDRNQPIIRDSRETKYYESKGHPEHQQWQKQKGYEKQEQQKHNNSNDQGRGNDKKNEKGKDKKGNH